MKKRIAAAATALFAFALPAGAAEKAEILTVNGLDTLTLNSSAAVAYRQYFAEAGPLILAAHRSGQWVTQTTGPNEACQTGAVDYRRFIRSTLAQCEGGERYGECWIVAIGGKIVWDGKIRFKRGKWTPKLTKRQFSVALAVEQQVSARGYHFDRTVGIATYGRDGKSANLTFKKHAVLGSCKGTLRVAQGDASPFTLDCTKAGRVTGLVDIAADGRTGRGSGTAKGDRHVEFSILQNTPVPQTKKQAPVAANAS